MQSPNRDLVQYYVVNEELSMSAGKIAAQVAHAATTMTLHVLLQDQGSHETYQAWLNQGQKKNRVKRKRAGAAAPNGRRLFVHSGRGSYGSAFRLVNRRCSAPDGEKHCRAERIRTQVVITGAYGR